MRLLKNLDWGAEVAEGSATTVFSAVAHTHSKWAETISVTRKSDAVDRD